MQTRQTLTSYDFVILSSKWSNVADIHHNSCREDHNRREDAQCRYENQCIHVAVTYHCYRSDGRRFSWSMTIWHETYDESLGAHQCIASAGTSRKHPERSNFLCKMSFLFTSSVQNGCRPPWWFQSECILIAKSISGKPIHTPNLGKISQTEAELFRFEEFEVDGRHQLE